MHLPIITWHQALSLRLRAQRALLQHQYDTGLAIFLRLHIYTLSFLVPGKVLPWALPSNFIYAPALQSSL